MLTDKNIQLILEAALSTGADYSEIFIENDEADAVGILNGYINKASTSFVSGIGIRIIKGVNSVYTFTNSFDIYELISLAKNAAKSLCDLPVDSNLSIVIPNCQRTTASSVQISPNIIKKSDKADYLRLATSYANKNSMITQTTGSISYSNRTIQVANSYGKNVIENNERIRLAFSVVATKDNEKQTSSFSPGCLRGYEFINDFPLEEEINRIVESSNRMVNAGYAPSGKMPVVIGNGFGGVIFHEACGHALEATSVGIKASCFTDMIGKQIASEVVTARDDARLIGEWGSYLYDDEGNDSSNLLLIENGILKNYLIDEIGSRRMNMKPTGCSRRQDYSYSPTSRMSNTYIDNGKSTPEEIISNTEYGLYASQMGGGSVDTTTGEFNFAVSEGYIIRNGKLAEPVRGATLIGKGPEVLMNIDMVGNDLKLAAGVCGSVSGSVPTSVGQPTLRVSSIIVGGRD